MKIENISCRVNYADSDGDINNSLTPEAPLLSELNGREDADIIRANKTDGTGRLSSSLKDIEGYIHITYVNVKNYPNM